MSPEHLLNRSQQIKNCLIATLAKKKRLVTYLLLHFGPLPSTVHPNQYNFRHLNAQHRDVPVSEIPAVVIRLYCAIQTTAQASKRITVLAISDSLLKLLSLLLPFILHTEQQQICCHNFSQCSQV
jgi:hypothetical protein